MKSIIEIFIAINLKKTNLERLSEMGVHFDLLLQLKVID